MADELPAEYHGVVTPGITYCVDKDVRGEIEAWLRKGSDREPTLVVDTIYGETVTLINDVVLSIYSTSRESRDRDRAHGKLVRSEVPIEERE